MTTPQGLAVSAAHDAAQARLLNLGLAEVAVLFSKFVTPASLDSQDYARLAALSVAKTRAQAIEIAMAFYGTLRAVETASQGPAALFLVPRPPAPATALLETSMAVTGPISAKSAIGNGATTAEALATALTRTLGAATRLVEGGPRDVTRLAAVADPLARGWVRRSGGIPCSFCAMLISRGPVYTGSSGFGTNTKTGKAFIGEAPNRFRAHDHCHCKAVAFFGSDTGWTQQSAEFAEIWRSGDPTAKAFDRAYREKYPRPKKPPEVVERPLAA